MTLISALNSYHRISQFSDVAALIGGVRGVSREELFDERRFRRVVWARQEIAWICRHLLKMSLPEIGRAMGVDHTTVLNSLRRMNARLADCSYLVEFTSIVLNVHPPVRPYNGDLIQQQINGQRVGGAI